MCLSCNNPKTLILDYFTFGNEESIFRYKIIFLGDIPCIRSAVLKFRYLFRSAIKACVVSLTKLSFQSSLSKIVRSPFDIHIIVIQFPCNGFKVLLIGGETV